MMAVIAKALILVLSAATIPIPAFAISEIVKNPDILTFDAGNLKTDNDLLGDPIRQVLDIIRSVEALPACNKVASAALLQSCSVVDGSSTSEAKSSSSIDEAKSIYATRLAICELLDAANPVPTSCSAFVPTKKNTRKRGIKGFLGGKESAEPVIYYQDYDQATEMDLKQCTTALGSKPQWWTSYSNARQNAVVMCHAMRAQVDKDELLHLHLTLNEILSQAVTRLATSNDEFATAQEHWDAVIQSMGTFQNDLYRDMAGFHDIVEQYASQLKQGCQGLNSDITSIRNTAQHIKADLERHQAERGQSHDVEISQREATFSLMQQQMMTGFANMGNTMAVVQHAISGHAEQFAALESRVLSSASYLEVLQSQLNQFGAIFDEVQAHSNSTVAIVETLHREMSSLPSIPDILLGLRSSWMKLMALTTKACIAFVVTTGLTFALIERFPLGVQARAMASLSCGTLAAYLLWDLTISANRFPTVPDVLARCLAVFDVSWTCYIPQMAVASILCCLLGHFGFRTKGTESERPAQKP